MDPKIADRFNYLRKASYGSHNIYKKSRVYIYTNMTDPRKEIIELCDEPLTFWYPIHE